MLLVVAVVISGLWFFTRDSDEPIAQEEPSDVVEVVEPPAELSKVEIFADDMNEFGVKKTSTFSLTFTNAVDMETVKSNVQLDPPTPFDVVEISDREYKLTPNESLIANTVYNISYDDLDYGKAFQTADDIKIFQSFPGDGAYDVPTRSGIELRFNVNNVTDISEYFSISPPVDGDFVYNEKSVVFMPETLDAGVYYTVTIEPGLIVDNREMMAAHSFTFNTGYSDDYNWNISYSVMNVMPEETPIVAINSWQNYDQVHVKVYQATAFNQFNETYLAYLKNNNNVDLDDYTLVFDDDVNALIHRYNPYVELPVLSNGRYIAIIEGEGLEQYVFIQSDPHQIYYSKATNGELFWVVDGESKSLVENAIITTEADEVWSTDDEGLLFITSTDADVFKQYVVTVDEKSYIVDSEPTYSTYYYDGFYSERSNENYWTFLYSDRSVYQKTDSVYLFGYLRSYEEEMPKDLHVVMKHYYDDENLLDVPVVMTDHLSISVELNLDDFDYGYYNVLLLNGEEVISSKEISILNYEKPEIRLESSIEEAIIYADDVIHYNLKAAYFNDLPYADMQVDIEQDDMVNFGSLGNVYSTDDAGEVNLEILVKTSDEYWYPDRYSVRASNAGIEDTYLNSWVSTLVVPRNIMIRSDYEIENNSANVVVKTNHIDISQYSGSFGVDYENIKGDVVDARVTVSIVDNYYEKNFIKTEYDPIHKVSYDVYEYYKVETPLQDITVNTVDGVATFELPVVDDHYYSVIYHLTDDQNRSVKASTTIGTTQYRWFNYDVQYTMPFENERYDIGDNIEKEVLNYGEPIESRADDFALHLFLRDGVIDYQVTEDAKIAFDFIESFRPNIFLKTIYFDGKTMNIVPDYESYLIGYDYETLEGEINAVADAVSYEPGDTVQLDVTVLDADGQPFTGDLNVSIVDEAYFALYEDYFDIGSRLHAYVYNDGIIHEAVSNVEKYGMDGAEAGEGGDDDYVRDDFKDTAYFETIKIENGHGVVSFDVPDNLSSWRITLHAVNEELAYASSKINVNVVLPYFVRALYNTAYLKGDEVYVSLKSDGTALSEGDQIVYTADLLLLGSNVVSSQVMTNTKGITNVLIGELNAEEYEVVVKGESGLYKDGIKESLTVEETYLHFDHKKTSELKSDYELMNAEQNTDLYFYNEQARNFRNQVYSSYLYDDERVEEIIARFGAYALLDRYFEDYEYDIYNVDYFQDWNGGIKPLKTADASVETTALIAAIGFGIEHFDGYKLLEYLREQLTNDALPLEQKALVLWALAAQGEPVLLTIDQFLEVNAYEKLSLQSKLYIVSALQELKDKTRVFALSDILFKAIEDEEKISEQDFVIAATLANRVGIKLDVFDQVADRDFVTKESIGLQRIYYMYHKPIEFEGASVVVEIDGKGQQIELPGVNFVKVVVPNGETFEVINITNEVYVTEVYRVSGMDHEQHNSNRINVVRTYDHDEIKQGDVVEVNLAYTKPVDSYIVIMDMIPAGFEFAGYKERQSYYLDYYLNQTNQEIRLPLYSKESSGSVSYYIRAIQKGKYHVDPAVVQMYYEEELYMTESTILEVN